MKPLPSASPRHCLASLRNQPQRPPEAPPARPRRERAAGYGLARTTSLLIGATLLWLNVLTTQAANFSLQWEAAKAALVPDGLYNDGESAGFVCNPEPNGVVGVMRGRDYGLDPTFDRWGLLDNSLPANFSTPGWLVRHGFPPNALYSTAYTYKEAGVPTSVHASYIEVDLTPPPGLEFASVSVTLGRPENLDFVKTGWGRFLSGSTLLGTAPAVITGYNADKTAVWTFPIVPGTFTGPIRLELYGILGADDGTFDVLRIDGTLEGPVPSPEPTVGLMVIGAAVAWTQRRRRTSPQRA
jgi:hypothetical protein